MKIYIFRHAQKAMDFTGDPDLTLEGHAQAQRILVKVLKNELPRPTELWVSPKKRTHSTFRPLSMELKIPLKNTEGLLEQLSTETLHDFRQRIENVLNQARKNPDAIVFLCSHYDWVLEAMTVIPSETDLTDTEFTHWSPSQYAGFRVHPDGLFEFIELQRN